MQEKKERRQKKMGGKQLGPASQSFLRPYLCFRNWSEAAKTLSKTLMEPPHIGCCHPVWKTFWEPLLWNECCDASREWKEGMGEGDKRWLRFPSGERVPLFSKHIADDKRGLMNRDKRLQTLFWVGPASLWHIKPAWRYFLHLLAIFFSFSWTDI